MDGERFSKCPEHSRGHCKECNFGLCQHNEMGDRCRECNTHFCQHGRRKNRCKECGTGMCEHDKIKERCRVCHPREKKGTSVPAALTDSNLEAHDFRLEFAAGIVKSFAGKRKAAE